MELKHVSVGVLALQGSFREHIVMLNKLAGVSGMEVRTREQLSSVDGLIIPGGESTAMALIAERWGLIPDLKEFSAKGNPVWGTCAGLIFLADRATGQKKGGQALLGGLDCLVHRNYFGSQIHSFEADIPAPACLPQAGPCTGSFKAVFIRAPAVMSVGEGVEVVAQYHLTEEEKAVTGEESVAVAVRSGPLLATAFHPELTNDLRWHQMFVDMVRKSGKGAGVAAPSTEPLPSPATSHNLAPSEVQDLKPTEPDTKSPAGSCRVEAADGRAVVSEVGNGGKEGFSERVSGKAEVSIEYGGQVVARVKCEGGIGEPSLVMDPLLKGRLNFPMDGLVQSIERAKQLLQEQ